MPDVRDLKVFSDIGTKRTFVDIEVTGLEKAFVGIQREIDDKVKKAKQAFARTGYDIEKAAKRLCPVDTGRLRGSIQTDVSRLDDFIVEVVAGDTAQGITYALPVEFGTSRARAQPFMTPAAEIGRGKLIERLRKI